MSALTDYFSNLATAIRAKTGKSTQLSPTDMVDEVDAVYQKGYDDATPVTQTKTTSAMPAASNRTITPDSGKLLSSVTIPAAWGGNPKTGMFTHIGPVTPSGTYSGQWTLQTEANCWYFFSAPSINHGMPVASISGTSDWTSVNINGTLKSDGSNYGHVVGIIFKATGSIAVITISGTGSSAYTSLNPVFFKIADP